MADDDDFFAVVAELAFTAEPVAEFTADAADVAADVFVAGLGEGEVEPDEAVDEELEEDVVLADEEDIDDTDFVKLEAVLVVAEEAVPALLFAVVEFAVVVVDEAEVETEEVAVVEVAVGAFT